MSKWVHLVLLTLSLFVPTVFSSDDKNTVDKQHVDADHYWSYQGKASDHLANEAFDADLGSSVIFSLDDLIYVSKRSSNLMIYC